MFSTQKELLKSKLCLSNKSLESSCGILQLEIDTTSIVIIGHELHDELGRVLPIQACSDTCIHHVIGVIVIVTVECFIDVKGI